jgi:hypothetical protein
MVFEEIILIFFNKSEIVCPIAAYWMSEGKGTFLWGHSL